MKAKAKESLQGTEKEFLDIFKTLCYSRSSWQVWADLMSAIACSLSNAADRTQGHYERREQEYAECIKRLGSVETPARLFAVIVEALEHNPEQDFLGKMYMNLELGNHWKGQFFTPYNVCKMMSEITIGNVSAEIERRGYVSICDPACGAGARNLRSMQTSRKHVQRWQMDMQESQERFKRRRNFFLCRV